MPWVDRAPLEIIREHVRLTLAALRCAAVGRMAVARLCEHLGSEDMLLFSSDYPHWHFEGDEALPEGLPGAIVDRVLSGNPKSTYPRIEARHDARDASHHRGRGRRSGGERASPPPPLAPSAPARRAQAGQCAGATSWSSTSRASSSRSSIAAPHQGGSLCRGKLVGLVEADGPGRYRYTRRGEIIRCPWHGWEFDLRTGKSQCDPKRTWVRSYPAVIAPGSEIAEGPYVAETFDVVVEEDYVIIET